MGYNITQRSCDLTIRKENFPALMAAAINCFPKCFDSLSSVREVFDHFDFSVEADAQGNLTGLRYYGEGASEEDQLFQMIAPYVEPGSTIGFEGEDGDLWEYHFDGTACSVNEPLYLWPEKASSLKNGQALYELPFSISGTLSIPAKTIDEATEAARNLDKIAVLQRVLSMLLENGTARYLQPDEMKKMED